MSSVRRRRLAAAALAVSATVALSACGTGFDAQTNKVYQAGVGANHRGAVDVLNTLLVANKDTTATISAGLVNNTTKAQSISSVTVTTMKDEPLKLRSTKVLFPLPKDKLATIGGATDAGGWVLLGGGVAGHYVKVTFSFTDAAPVTIEAPVVARTAEYDSVTG